MIFTEPHTCVEPVALLARRKVADLAQIQAVARQRLYHLSDDALERLSADGYQLNGDH